MAGYEEQAPPARKFRRGGRALFGTGSVGLGFVGGGAYTICMGLGCLGLGLGVWGFISFLWERWFFVASCFRNMPEFKVDLHVRSPHLGVQD